MGDSVWNRDQPKAAGHWRGADLAQGQSGRRSASRAHGGRGGRGDDWSHRAPGGREGASRGSRCAPGPAGGRARRAARRDRATKDARLPRGPCPGDATPEQASLSPLPAQKIPSRGQPHAPPFRLRADSNAPVRGRRHRPAARRIHNIFMLRGEPRSWASLASPAFPISVCDLCAPLPPVPPCDDLWPPLPSLPPCDLWPPLPRAGGNMWT
jgi:hypothetical protein